jgi:hypothetical protein
MYQCIRPGTAGCAGGSVAAGDRCTAREVAVRLAMHVEHVMRCYLCDVMQLALYKTPEHFLCQSSTPRPVRVSGALFDRLAADSMTVAARWMRAVREGSTKDCAVPIIDFSRSGAPTPANRSMRECVPYSPASLSKLCSRFARACVRGWSQHTRSTNRIYQEHTTLSILAMVSCGMRRSAETRIFLFTRH